MPQLHPPPQKHSRLTAAWKRLAAVWKAANANGIVAVAAVVIAGLAFTDQHHAAVAQDQVDQANASAALRHDASLVTFFVQAVPNSTKPQLVVENRSAGTIRNLEIFLSIPLQGCSVHCHYRGYAFVRLPDIPPCSIAPTTVLSVIKSPPIGPAALAKSALYFTDPRGNAWDLYGYGRLVRRTSVHGTGEFSWGGFATLKPAGGCS